jgi:outer membrane protein OmpA-like peptidoglycan-associated protein
MGMKITALTLALGLASCATTGNSADNNNYKNTKESAAIGALAGAALGAIVGYNGNHGGGALRGALVGAAAGGALGAGVGSYMDKQQAAFDERLAAEERANQIEVQRLKDQSLKITMNSEVSFDLNSAAIKPAFNATLDKVADILSRFNRTHIRIVGYTDSTGTAAYNQLLSQQRAQAVGNYLEDRGVAPQRLSIVGMGEAQPRASNATPAGRQLNRRVEMLIIPDQDLSGQGGQ